MIHKCQMLMCQYDWYRSESLCNAGREVPVHWDSQGILYGSVEIWIWSGRKSRERAFQVGGIGPPDKYVLEGAICCETVRKLLFLKGFWGWGGRDKWTSDCGHLWLAAAACWQVSPRATHISACLLAREALTALYSRLPFQGCLTVIVCPSGVKGKPADCAL